MLLIRTRFEDCMYGRYEVEVEVKLRPTVSRPVRLGVRHPSGTRDQFYFLLSIFFTLLRVCYFVAPSLTGGRVCNLLFLLVLASAVPLGSESRGTQDHILLSQFFRLSQPGGPGPHTYIPQEQGGPDIPPDYITDFLNCEENILYHSTSILLLKRNHKKLSFQTV
jgi:hypothetical protein